MSKAANQVLPECGTFSTTTRVVFFVTLYLSFFDGWLIGLRAALRAVLWRVMVRMIDFLAHGGGEELEEGGGHGTVRLCAPLEMAFLVFDQSCAACDGSARVGAWQRCARRCARRWMRARQLAM